MRNISARWWAFAYLLLIPICALIYYFLPRFYPNQAHFYHASAQYEKALYDDADSIIKQLREVLAQNFPGTGSEYATQKNGWTIAVKGVRVRELQPGENTIRIEFGKRIEKSTSARSLSEYLFAKRDSERDRNPTRLQCHFLQTTLAL